MGGPATGIHCPSQDRKARRTMTTKKKKMKKKIEKPGEGKKKKKKRRAVGHLGRKLFCRQVAVIIMSVGWRRFESGLTLGEKQGVLAYN